MANVKNSVCMYVCKYICMCIYVRTYVYICVYVCVYVCICLYVCVYVCICLYVYVNLLTFKLFIKCSYQACKRYLEHLLLCVHNR